jgi:hypothetical protein
VWPAAPPMAAQININAGSDFMAPPLFFGMGTIIT